MKKILKYIVEIALAISIILNVIVVMKLNNQLTRFDNVEIVINRLSSSINYLDNKISYTNNSDKEDIQKDIMTPTELAQYLKIDMEQIYKLIIENPDSKFPQMKINNEVRFSKKAIDEYMVKQNNILIK